MKIRAYFTLNNHWINLTQELDVPELDEELIRSELNKLLEQGFESGCLMKRFTVNEIFLMEQLDITP